MFWTEFLRKIKWANGKRAAQSILDNGQLKLGEIQKDGSLKELKAIKGDRIQTQNLKNKVVWLDPNLPIYIDSKIKKGSEGPIKAKISITFYRDQKPFWKRIFK